MNLNQFENFDDLYIGGNEKKIFKVLEGDLIQYGPYFFKNWSPKLKTVYERFITGLLNDMYGKYIVDGYIKKKYPLDDTDHSFLNYVNTHFTCLSYIINFLNIRILEGIYSGNLIATRQLDFNDDNKYNWYKELANAMKLISKFRNQLFKPGNKVFDRMYDAVRRTTSIGYGSEDRLTKYIEGISPKIGNIKHGGHGDYNDTIKGIDLTFDYGDKTFTLQHKKVGTVELNNGIFTINGIGNNRVYRTDYISYETHNGKIYLFKNRNVVIVDSTTSKIPYDNWINSKKGQ